VQGGGGVGWEFRLPLPLVFPLCCRGSVLPATGLCPERRGTTRCTHARVHVHACLRHCACAGGVRVCSSVCVCFAAHASPCWPQVINRDLSITAIRVFDKWRRAQMKPRVMKQDYVAKLTRDGVPFDGTFPADLQVGPNGCGWGVTGNGVGSRAGARSAQRAHA
jgi:hypothetical protein